MILEQLHAAHKARIERMTRYAQASYEPPPLRPAPEPEPEPPKPLPEIGAMRRIVLAVSQASGISVADITSQSRLKNIAAARHVYYWMCRTLAKKSDHEIGKYCGARNHSSVISGRFKVQKRMPEFQWLIDASKKALDDMPRLGDAE